MTTAAQEPATGEATLPLAALREQCEPIERDLLFRKRVVAGALDGVRPGGAENEGTGPDAWLKYLLHLTRLHARDGASSSSASTSDNSALNDAIEKSVAKAPEMVHCDDGVTRAVHPKSYVTLRYLDQLDAMNRLNAGLMAEHANLDRLEDVTVHVHGLSLEMKAVRVWLWILSHPGCGLPFDEMATDPKPPKWTTRATPEDLVRFAAAHYHVHVERNNIISTAFPPDPAAGTTRLPLSGFIAAMAQEAGHPPSDLMRLWSLGEIMAQSAVSARAAKEAEQRAKNRPPTED